MKTKEKAQVVLAGMFLITGMLIIISAVGGSEIDTITFVEFMLSIFIGFSFMAVSCFIVSGIKR